MFRSHYRVVSEYRQFGAIPAVIWRSCSVVVKRDLSFFGCLIYVTNCTTHEYWV